MTQPDGRAAFSTIVELLAPGNSAVMAEVLLAFDDPVAYFAKYADRLEDERGIDEPQDDLAWIALVDQLTDHGLLAEADWREDSDEVCRLLTTLRNHPAHASWDWYEALDDDHGLDTYAFLTMAGEQFLRCDTALVILDIDSDCYPVCFVAKADAEALTGLAAAAGHQVQVLGRDR